MQSCIFRFGVKLQRRSKLQRIGSIIPPNISPIGGSGQPLYLICDALLPGTYGSRSYRFNTRILTHQQLDRNSPRFL